MIQIYTLRSKIDRLSKSWFGAHGSVQVRECMSTEEFCAVCSASFRDLQMNSDVWGGFRDSVSNILN